jgi:hypothetical protein
MSLCCAAGVQALLDGVSDYLPCPTDIDNTALDLDHGEQALTLPCRSVETHSTPSQQGVLVQSRLQRMVGLEQYCWGTLETGAVLLGSCETGAVLSGNLETGAVLLGNFERETSMRRSGLHAAAGMVAGMHWHGGGTQAGDGCLFAVRLCCMLVVVRLVRLLASHSSWRKASMVS